MRVKKVKIDKEKLFKPFGVLVMFESQDDVDEFYRDYNSSKPMRDCKVGFLIEDAKVNGREDYEK